MSIPIWLLLLSDFDGTIARTFDESPNKLDVHKVHHWTLVDLFGQDILQLYHKHGGLQNRAPGELIGSLIELDPTLTRRVLGDRDSQFSQQQAIVEVTEMFVRRKLGYLLAEITPEWPKPCEGFLDFHKQLGFMREAGLDVDLGIVSNGHVSFIGKTFDMWGIACPRVLVTDDHIRNRCRPKRMEDRVKPAILPFNLAMREWRKRHPQGKLPSRVIYLGDDPKKDGGLARNAGVPFGWFTDDDAGDLSVYPRGSFRFSDWRLIGESLMSRLKDLLQGLPCDEIFS